MHAEADMTSLKSRELSRWSPGDRAEFFKWARLVSAIYGLLAVGIVSTYFVAARHTSSVERPAALASSDQAVR